MSCVCSLLQQSNDIGGTVPIEIREKLRDTQMAFKNLLAMVQQLQLPACVQCMYTVECRNNATVCVCVCVLCVCVCVLCVCVPMAYNIFVYI